MALIKCPECKNEISDKAENCPKCGYPILSEICSKEEIINFSPPLKNKNLNKNTNGSLKPWLWIILIIFLIIWLNTNPKITLWFGYGILIFCILYLFKKSREFSRKFLRLLKKNNSEFNNLWIFILYIFVGFVFVTISHGNLEEIKQEKLQLLQKEKQQREQKNLENIAKIKVDSIIIVADNYLKKGQITKAKQKIKEVDLIKNLSDKKSVEIFKKKISDFKFKNIENKIKKLLRKRKINETLKYINSSYKKIGKAYHSRLKKYETMLTNSTNNKASFKFFMNLPFKDFNIFIETEKLPKSAKTEFKVLNDLLRDYGIYNLSMIKEERNRIEKEKRELAEKKEQEEKDRKYAAALAKRLKERRKLIESSFSAWDGSHYGLENFIKKIMNDPDSYEHVLTTYQDKDTYLLVTTAFRGKNAFGGKVISTISAKVDFKGNVLEIVSQ